MPGLTVYGITDPDRLHHRTCTFGFGFGPQSDPDALVQQLVSGGINCTSGNHYNTYWEETLGLDNVQGVARVGFLHYNTMADVDAVLEQLERASQRFAK